jgi:rhodanese-related sulfurtransferase
MSQVTAIPAADSAQAVRHFEAEFTFETDCWDVHAALESGGPDFILLDVRGRELFDQGHIAGALHLPHGKIIASRIEAFPDRVLFVVYCAGPHCNGAARAALRLARLGRAVKIMAGGIAGWRDEGFELNREPTTVEA